MSVLDRIKDHNLGNGQTDVNDNYSSQPAPIDGTLYPVSEYLSMLKGQNFDFYLRYLDHLNYFANLFRFEGVDDIERLSPFIFRQLIEFGKVGIAKIRGKYIALAVVNAEYDQYQKLKKFEGIPVRTGIGYNKNTKAVNVPVDNVVVLRANYLGLPFISIWKKVIERIINLSDAAETGSIATIKKFHRRLNNNDSSIAKLETKSMTDPKTPYINTIVSPISYMQEINKRMSGDVKDDNNTPMLLMANDVDFNSMESSAEGLWENLQAYLKFEYFQKGRRINTNKKSERNVSKEVNTETVNFDILDEKTYSWLRIGVKEMDEKFGEKPDIIAVVLEKEQEEGEVVQNETI